MRFFARLARDLLRWARRRRPSTADRPTGHRPNGQGTSPGAPAGSTGASPDPPPSAPPPLPAATPRPRLAGEAVACVVGDPFADWLLIRTDTRTLLPADRAGERPAPATTICFPHGSSLRCDGPAVSGQRLRSGDDLEVAALATPTAVWTVSVVLVATDQRAGLHRPVGSVLGQSYPAWELLVVETGQAPPALVAPSDPRVRVVHAPGTTMATGRRRGLEAATGEIIAHLDERSLMTPRWLADVVASLVVAPADVVLGATVPEGHSPEREADWELPGAVAHHRHVPLCVVDRLLAPEGTEVVTDLSMLAPGLSVRLLAAPAATRRVGSEKTSPPTSEPLPVIDLTAEHAVHLAMAGRR